MEIVEIFPITFKGKGGHRGFLLLHFFRVGCSSDACVPGQPEKGLQGNPAAVRFQAVVLLLAGLGLGIAGIETAHALVIGASGFVGKGRVLLMNGILHFPSFRSG